MRFSSSTSCGELAGRNDQVDLIGFENRGSQTGHGDSGVEADLSALNLADKCQHGKVSRTIVSTDTCPG